MSIPRTLLLLLAALTLSACSEERRPPDGHADADAALPDAAPIDAPDPLPDGAVNPCLGASGCGECTARTPCGWCGDRCLAGTPTGSFDGTCTGTAWLWRRVQCPGAGMQCPGHLDCVSCAADPDLCGWCANAGRCFAGDRSGPARPVEGCSESTGAWIYNLNRQTCP